MYNLIEGDVSIINKIRIRVDAELVSGMINEGILEFQFPPTIKSDQKSMMWSPFFKDYAWEPDMRWRGGNPRKMTIKATFIVGGPRIINPFGGSKEATPQNVAEVLRGWKQYFWTDGPSSSLLPTFKVAQLYEHTPESGRPANYRGTNISISFSDTKINKDGFVFPLRSDVTLQMEQVTDIEDKEGKKVSNHAGMANKPIQDWY